MSDELSELKDPHEPFVEEPEGPPNSIKPTLMLFGIAVIVFGTGLLVWLGPTFNPRKPPPPPAVNVRARLKTMLQGMDGLEADARRAKVPELSAALRMDDEDIRLGACLALGQIGKDAVPSLIPLLDDPDANVRYYAVWALGQIGPNAGDALPAIQKALRDSDGDVRRKAVFALGRVKPTAALGIPALTAAFEDDDVEVRAAAVDALAAYGPAAVPALRRTIRQATKLEPRRLAVLALTRIGPAAHDALPELRPLFSNSNSGLADEAAAALATLGKPAIPTLAESLRTDPVDPVAQVARGLGSPWAMLAAWHDYPEQHRRALRSLGKIGPDALDQIVIALHSPNGDIREQAAGVLGAIGFRDRRVLVPLVEAMRDPEAGVRHQAGWALKELAPEPRILMPGLTRAMRDERPDIRFNAIAFLGQLGADAMPPLIESLGDPDEKARRQAVRSLQELRVPDEVLMRAVLPRLKDAATEIRQSAVAVLQRCGRLALPELIGALQDKDAVVRQQAIQSFATLPPDAQAILPALTAALRDDDAYVRAGAVAALVRYVGQQPSVFPLVRSAAKDTDPKVRLTAMAVLSRFGVPAVPFLIDAMRDPDPEVWRKIIEVLREMEVPTKTLQPLLTRALKDDDANLRQGAAYALSRFGADAVPALLEVMKDPDPNVQWAAVDTLDTIGPPARKAVAALARAAATNPSPKIRRGALTALVTIHGFAQHREKPTKAVPGLIELLDDPDADIRWGAIQTLAAIGPSARNAVPPLTRLLEDKNPSVVESARYALRRIQGK